MVEQNCLTCTHCGKQLTENNNFTLDHTAGFYGEDKDPTIVREGVFCSRSCMISWLQEAKAGKWKAYGIVEKESLLQLGEVCVDLWEDSPAHDQFCRILHEFGVFSKISPWEILDSPFATNTSSIMCLPFDQYKKLRKLQLDLKNFLDSARQGFDEKIYGPMELEQAKEADG